MSGTPDRPVLRAVRRISAGVPVNPECGNVALIVMRPCTEAEIASIIREEIFCNANLAADPSIAAPELEVAR